MLRIKLIALCFLISYFSYAKDFSMDEIIDNTTINLMWIYKEKPGNNIQKYIFPEPYIREISQRNKSIKEYINSFNRIQIWSQLNPKNKIIIWHDAQTAPDGSIEATLNKFEELGINNIEILDIRNLIENKKELKKYYEEFFNRELSMAYISDILRILATYEVLQKALDINKTEFFAYFDFSIDPITLSNLYAYQGTVEKLNKYGFILGKTDQTRYENSFHVMGNNKPNLLLAFKGAIINKNIIRLIINKKNFNNYEQVRPQAVYGDYSGFIDIFYALEGYGIIYEKEFTEKIDEDPALIEISKDQLEGLITFKAISQGKLLTINQGEINGTFYDFKPGPVVEKEGRMEIPTRACISKLSKLNY